MAKKSVPKKKTAPKSKPIVQQIVVTKLENSHSLAVDLAKIQVRLEDQQRKREERHSKDLELYHDPNFKYESSLTNYLIHFEALKAKYEPSEVKKTLQIELEKYNNLAAYYLVWGGDFSMKTKEIATFIQSKIETFNQWKDEKPSASINDAPQIEPFNKGFKPKYADWAVLFCVYNYYGKVDDLLNLGKREVRRFLDKFSISDEDFVTTVNRDFGKKKETLTNKDSTKATIDNLIDHIDKVASNVNLDDPRLIKDHMEINERFTSLRTHLVIKSTEK